MPKATKIDLNSATTKDLTQLPGIAKNIAYNIVNHRKRHGLFTAWQELLEVKEFPSARLKEIRARAELRCPPGEDCVPPRHLEHHLEDEAKKPKGYTKSLRASRRPEKVHAENRRKSA
jgi:hypothetical protein